MQHIPTTPSTGLPEFNEGVRITRLDAFVFRAPAEPPVQTSFGVMHNRPAVLVRVMDEHGTPGWGEIWCNFPTVGAEHRARLVTTYGRPLVTSQVWRHPAACYHHLQERLAVLALQTAEHGPLQQIIAGIDVAIWDLFARRHGLPMWRALGATTVDPVAVYASGINPTQPGLLAQAKLAQGYRAFKLKVGFGLERDLANLAEMRDVIGPDAALMVDANQAWQFDEAVQAANHMAAFNLGWLEEPLRADEPAPAWQRLAAAQPVRLAGGENLLNLSTYDAFIQSPGMAVIQPDIGKWGGFTGCLEVARRAQAAGKWYCPHWLGAGIGLTASMHLKAAVGGPGYVEVDANPNPLRDMLAMPAFSIVNGQTVLSDRPGLGVEPDLTASACWRVTSISLDD